MKKNEVFRPEIGYGSRLYKGKVLAPLTPIVLDGIHLCLFLSKGCVLCLCLYANECKRNTGKRRKYLQVCSFKPRDLMPTYPFQESERRSSAHDFLFVLCFLVGRS